MAGILCDASRTTPVFARFSNLTGSAGSSDTCRDVRGFAVKMYTTEGNWDMLCQNIPVSPVRDGEDFSDFSEFNAPGLDASYLKTTVHSIKPEPHTGLSYGHLGHNNFWDFVTLHPESVHMALWLMSDHGIPRSYRMMNGFGVNTFTTVNKQSQRHYVRFQWVPMLGTRFLHPEEAVKLAGHDPDYYRRDLRESIVNKCYPKWNLAIQTIPETEAGDMELDIFDPTRVWPEDRVPLRVVGVLELNHNVDEMFSQVEQAAFRPTNLVPGMGISPDPLLQYRALAYADAQARRVGSNVAELPVNRPCCPVLNHNRDGEMRLRITRGSVNYWPNRFWACPPDSNSLRTSRESKGPKLRDHHTETPADNRLDSDQLKSFINSLDDIERKHITASLALSLGYCDDPTVPERFLNQQMVKIDPDIARCIAEALGVELNNIPRPGEAQEHQTAHLQTPPSVINTHGRSLKVAVFVDNGYDKDDLEAGISSLQAAGCFTYVISSTPAKVFHAGADPIHSTGLRPDYSLLTRQSTEFDGLFVPGGLHIDELARKPSVRSWVSETFWHFKPIGVTGNAAKLVRDALSTVLDIELATDDTKTVDWYGIVSTIEKVRPYSVLGVAVPRPRSDFVRLFHNRICERSIRQRERKFGNLL